MNDVGTVTAASRIALYALSGMVGLAIVFYPTLASGFRMMQVEPGDSLLNHYFLEHFYKWVTDSDYIGELWSPPFMWPYKETLALSDNLFAAGPFYWVFRAVSAPDIAYQLWMMAMFALDFASFCWLGRKIGASPLLSTVGAFIFAFGMPRTAQIGHQQLLPQFYTPLALGCFWELSRNPSVRALSLALIFTYLQVMAGIYLGWFLLFSLTFFLPVLFLFTDGAMRGLLELFRSTTKAWAVAIAWMAGMVISLLPYLRAQSVVGPRSFSEIDTMLPRLSSWFLPNYGSIYASVLQPDPNLPMVHEHWMFAGLSVWLMIAIAVWSLIHKLVSGDVKPLIWASGLTLAAVMLLSLRWPGGFTLWSAVYDYVPGAGAIRGVSRIWLIAYPYALVVGLIGCQALFTSHVASLTRKTLFATLLLIFAMAEQVLTDLPHFRKRPFLNDVAEIANLFSKDCDFAYLTHPSMPRGAVELRAMWAGIRTNVPVVNGYSGNYPSEYPYPAQNVAEVVDWLQRTDPNVNGDLCVILPADLSYSMRYRRGFISPLKRWQSFYLSVQASE